MACSGRRLGIGYDLRSPCPRRRRGDSRKSAACWSWRPPWGALIARHTCRLQPAIQPVFRALDIDRALVVGVGVGLPLVIAEEGTPVRIVVGHGPVLSFHYWLFV
jgi:hypothetical protein